MSVLTIIVNTRTSPGWNYPPCQPNIWSYGLYFDTWGNAPIIEEIARYFLGTGCFIFSQAAS
jgi:hypothetical protein